MASNNHTRCTTTTTTTTTKGATNYLFHPENPGSRNDRSTTSPTQHCQLSPRAVVKGNEEEAGMSPNLPICRLFSPGFGSDLTLTFPDGYSIKVHRSELAKHSPVFERLLNENWRNKEEVQILEDFESVRWLMHHLYCGLQHLPSWKVAVSVLQIAKRYCLPSATELATELLVYSVDERTFWTIFRVARSLSNERLLHACDQYLEESTDEMLEFSPTSTIRRDELHYLLDSPSFKPSSEMHVWNLLLTWAEHQIPEGKHSFTSSFFDCHPSYVKQVRAMLKEFLPKVRFLSMNSTEIHTVLTQRLFTLEEAKMLQRVMDGYPDASLPDIASCQTSSPRY